MLLEHQRGRQQVIFSKKEKNHYFLAMKNNNNLKAAIHFNPSHSQPKTPNFSLRKLVETGSGILVKKKNWWEREEEEQLVKEQKTGSIDVLYFPFWAPDRVFSFTRMTRVRRIFTYISLLGVSSFLWLFLTSEKHSLKGKDFFHQRLYIFYIFSVLVLAKVLFIK